MKGIRYLIFLLTILIPSVAAAATSTQYGESGLVSVPTAEITERGVYNAAAWFNNSQNNGNKAARFPISLAMGLGFGWEFFGSYPDISFANQEDGSMGNFGSIGLKFRLTGGPYSNLKTSGTAFLRQTVSEDETLAGLRDLGAKLIMSYSIAKAGLHLNVGYLKVSSPETKTYNNEVLFGGAIDVPISTKMNSFLELDGNTKREGGSSRIELSPGVQYYLLPSIAMTGGIGFGLTDIGPDYRAVVGLTFTSGAGKYAKVIPIIPGSRERYAAMAETSIEELLPELPMETREGIAWEVSVASISGEASTGAPSMEALEAFQAPSPISEVPLARPGSKDILTPGGLIGSAEVEAVSLEPPMPIILTTPVEKAAMENIPLAPEIPGEAFTEAFVPPLPVSEEKVEVIEAGKEKAEVHQEVIEAAGEGQTRTKRYYVIWYEFRSSELTPFAKGILDRVGVENKGSGERFTVEIAGHTDNIGSAETNKKLSQKRSESAKDYLVIGHGFDPDLFEVKGYGEEMPDASNDTPEGRGKNRRVEITVYSGLKRAELAATLTPPAAVMEGTYRRPEIPAEIPLVVLAPPLPVTVIPGKALEEAKMPSVAPAALPLSTAVVSAASSQLPERQLKTGKRILYREILFLAEKSEPSPVVKGILDKMAEQAKKSGKRFVVMIDGHADSTEAVASLTELSYSRVNGVKDYLVQKHNFDSNAFVLKGHGKERSVASGNTPEGKGRNRRAEISVYSVGEGPETASALSPIPPPPASIESLKPVSEETSAPREGISLKPEIPAAAPPVTETPPLPVSETVSKNEERPTAGKKVLYKEILFFAEKSDPSPFVQGILDKVAEQVKKGGKRFVVKIEGHTDSQESTNLTELSYNRANSVKDYLVKKHGFAENTFVIKGYGSEKPIAPNSAPEGMKKNRRVEITVFEAKD